MEARTPAAVTKKTKIHESLISMRIEVFWCLPLPSPPGCVSLAFSLLTYTHHITHVDAQLASYQRMSGAKRANILLFFLERLLQSIMIIFPVYKVMIKEKKAETKQLYANLSTK